VARRGAVVLALIIGVVLPGCAREPDRPPVAGPSVMDDWGRTVSLRAPALRVVSLAPATTELVFALGAGERLVGRTTWCDFPAEAREVADVGNGIGPNVEAIAARRPDLVLLYPSESNRAALAQLERLGITVAVVEQDAIAEWRATARKVAVLLGVPAAADSLLSDLDRRLAAAGLPSAASRSPRPGVFIAVGANPPIAIGRGSFVSELVELAGGRNAFEDVPGPSAVVSLEAIVAKSPDMVLYLGADSAAPTIARRPGWSAIRAVRRGRVIGVEGSQFNRPSPRIPEAVTELRRRLFAP